MGGPLTAMLIKEVNHNNIEDILDKSNMVGVGATTVSNLITALHHTISEEVEVVQGPLLSDPLHLSSLSTHPLPSITVIKS